MSRKENAKGYEEFRKTIETLEKNNKNIKIYVYFVGQADTKGESWCPDCREAEPIVTKAMAECMSDKDIFLTVDVGDKETWKDLTNSFRKDSDVRLLEIPTILLWKGVARLKGDQCKNMDLLKMFFNEPVD